jgi:hypothetical protein
MLNLIYREAKLEQRIAENTIPEGKRKRMILAIDIWLLPAVAAASSSYLVSLAWEKIRSATAPTGSMAAFLAILSFIMGAICACYRHEIYSPSQENNIIVMFIVGATTTYFWLLLRKYFSIRVDSGTGR